MRAFALTAVLLAACADDAAQGPHDLVPCIDNPWPINGTDQITIEKCERACATMPTLESVGCMVDVGLGPQQVTETFQVDGRRGVCTYKGPIATLEVVFVECQ